MKKSNPINQIGNKPIICVPNNYFGQALKEIRIEKGVTQKNASKKLNLSQAQWSSYELGKSRPSLDMIILISKQLKINPFDLLNRSLQKSKLFKNVSFEVAQDKTTEKKHIKSPSKKRTLST